jgi:DtxR family Mn-dependent transcriptional regulator
MKLSDRAEEILERLWIELVENEKKYSTASGLTQGPEISELLRCGQIEIALDKVTLTEKGLEEARDCIRRHRLAERLMVDVLQVRKGLVHETGCEFEHLLHKGLDENVCTLLGHPETCPHGRPIPDGKCCRESRKQVQKLIGTLADLEPKKKVVVAYVQTQDKEALSKIMAIGAYPGTEITLLQKFPAIVIQIGKSQFAIDEKLASRIHVR